MTASEERMAAIVKQAVREELAGANLVDGPTHIAHHQALAAALTLMEHAKKTVIGALVRGVMALLLLGCLAWVWNNRG
jgi:hypothetical protein